MTQLFNTLTNPHFWEYIFHSNIINMLVVFSFLVWLFKKFDLLKILKSYSEEIDQEIKKVEQDKRMAQSVLQEMKESSKEIKRNINRIINDAKSSAQVMANRIDYEKEQRINEIHQNLNKMIEIESKSMKEQITQDFSEKVYLQAEEKIKQKLNEDLHNKFINDFIDNLDEKQVK